MNWLMKQQTMKAAVYFSPDDIRAVNWPDLKLAGVVSCLIS